MDLARSKSPSTTAATQERADRSAFLKRCYVEVRPVNDNAQLLNSNQIANARFDTGLDDWTVTGNTDWESSNGEVRFGQIGGANGTISQTFTTVIGQTYYVEFDYGDRSATQSQ